MKKLLSLFIITIGALLFGNSAFASEGESEIFYDYINKQYVFDIKMMDDQGNIREASFEEYMQEVEKSEKIKSELAKLEKANNSLESKKNESLNIGLFNSNPGVYYRYTEEATGQFLGRRVQVSNPLNCPYDSNGCSKTISYSLTKTINWAAGLSSQMKNAITASLNFSYSESVSNTESDTLVLKPGQSGWFEVAPYYNYSGGQLTTFYEGIKMGQEYKYSEFPAKLVTGKLKWAAYGVIK